MGCNPPSITELTIVSQEWLHEDSRKVPRNNFPIYFTCYELINQNMLLPVKQKRINQTTTNKQIMKKSSNVFLNKKLVVRFIYIFGDLGSHSFYPPFTYNHYSSCEGIISESIRSLVGKTNKQPDLLTFFRF